MKGRRRREPSAPTSTSRACHGKHQYDRKGAKAAQTRLQTRHDYERKFGRRLDAYKCHECGHWHIGHRPVSPRG